MDSRRRVYLSDVIEASKRLDELVLWLVSVYSLTEKGQEVANGKTEKVNFLRE